MTNHLEQLLSEWYEYQGYFVKRNILVSPRKNGGYETELDVIAYHPETKEVYHIETSLDTDSWAKREERFSKKFEIGKKEIPTILKGLEIKTIHQEAVLLFASKTAADKSPRERLGGGKLILAETYIHEIYAAMQSKKLNKAMVSEQFQTLRTIQFVANLKK